MNPWTFIVRYRKRGRPWPGPSFLGPCPHEIVHAPLIIPSGSGSSRTRRVGLSALRGTKEILMMARVAGMLALLHVACVRGKYVAFSSDRFYTSPQVPMPRRAPWPVLPLSSSVVSLSQATAPGSPLVALTTTGAIYLIASSGNSAKAGIAPIATATSQIGSFSVPKALATGVVTCEASGCSHYSCEMKSGSCTRIATFSMKLGSVTSLAVGQAGTAWLSSRDSGLIKVALSGTTATPSRFGRQVVGNVSALAIFEGDAASTRLSSTPATPLVAVATELAVYYELDETSGEFGMHKLVGEDIDAPAAALSFVRPAAAAKPIAAGSDMMSAGAASKVELWIGHKYCLNVIHPDGRVDRVSGAQGLPVGNITSLVRGSEDGTLWIGSAQGLALRCEQCDDVWRFFGADRWLAEGDAVVAIAASPASTPALSGGGATTASSSSSSSSSLSSSSKQAVVSVLPSVWVASASHGLAHISSRETTLEAKAAEYMARVGALSRYRYVTSALLGRYGDPTSLVLHDTDNDGLWTGMLVAAMAFRFAATQSDDARRLAWHHFAALEFLHNVTATAGVAPGFMARAAVKCGEPHGGGDSGICPKGSPPGCGWVNSSVCYAGVDPPGATDCCWTWKRDTSSDEVTGHIFAMFTVHELVAKSDVERARAAAPLCATVANIVDSGFILVDPVTGKGTSWGYWDPDQLNRVPGKPGERNENSLELLGYLAAAAKICDASASPRGRFGRAFASMVADHLYDANVINALATSPLSLATFDFRLAFMSFYTLAAAVPELSRAPVKASASPLVPLTPSVRRPPSNGSCSAFGATGTRVGPRSRARTTACRSQAPCTSISRVCLGWMTPSGSCAASPPRPSSSGP